MTGRPTKYRADFARQAKKACEMGATEWDLAVLFDVHVMSIRRWAERHPAFCEALKVAEDVADNRVERSLYHKACGYTFNAVKIFQSEGKTIEHHYVEHVPPDTTACIFWLKNRRPDLWRERYDHKHGGKVGLDAKLTIESAKQRLINVLDAAPIHEAPTLINGTTEDRDG